MSDSEGSPKASMALNDVLETIPIRYSPGEDPYCTEESVESESSTTEWLPLMLEEYLYTEL